LGCIAHEVEASRIKADLAAILQQWASLLNASPAQGASICTSNLDAHLGSRCASLQIGEHLGKYRGQKEFRPKQLQDAQGVRHAHLDLPGKAAVQKCFALHMPAPRKPPAKQVQRTRKLKVTSVDHLTKTSSMTEKNIAQPALRSYNSC
jgi:hypothetical protein